MVLQEHTYPWPDSKALYVNVESMLADRIAEHGVLEARNTNDLNE
jgi:hypothetical protein